MASRRTRIKGIANIPLRRRAAAEAVEQTEESNLQTIPSHVNDDSPINENCVKLVDQHDEEVNVNSNTNDESQEQRLCPVVKRGKDDQSMKEAPSVPEEVTPNTISAPKLPFSRRRVKPAISLKAIQKSSTPTNVASPPEELQATKPQEEPSPPENANLNAVHTPKTIESPISVSKLSPVTAGCNNKESTVVGITKLPLAQNLNVANKCTVDKVDEVTRPPSACSPNKYMNRARIKAIPRLGQRRPSFSIGSASESEDESKRSYSKGYRVRNDSVCSSISTPAPPESPAPAVETANTRKKMEFNSVIQRKCRRTEQSRKLAEARRDFQQKFSNGKPDRQKLTMIDLIFYNPASSPMSLKRKRQDTETECLNAQREEDIDDAPRLEEPVEPVAEGEKSDEENTVPAPQITIGANGEIIIDEKSLFIENKEVKRDREALKKSSLVDGDNFESVYGVYKRVKRSKDWSKDETLRFYKALNTIGTDFTLMSALFPSRTRRELKMKFKKEERVNRALVDRAVMQPIQFDISELEQDMEKVEMEKMRLEQIRKDQIQLREERKLAKENKKAKAEETAVKKKRKGCTIVEKPANYEPPKTAKRDAMDKLRVKIRGGINSLMSPDSDEENANEPGEVTQLDAISQTSEDEIQNEEVIENNNNIELGTAIEKEKIGVNNPEHYISNELEVATEGAEIESIEAIQKEVEKGCVEAAEKEIVEPMPTATIAEGSIVLSSSIVEGKEIYTVYSVNKNGEHVPIELNKDVLNVLLSNSNQKPTLEVEADLSIANESVVLPSGTTIDNIMADISLSNISDHPDLALTSADCMILSFDDIDTNIAANSTATIVAVQSGP